MIFRHRFVAIFAILFVCVSFDAAFARDVYVKLSQAGKYSIGITNGNIAMTDAEGRLSNLGTSTVISVSGNTANIAGNVFNLPLRLTGQGFLKFNGRTYRGTFLITQRAGLLNVLDVEQYLYGVLPAEVGASWPTEALRAQAIISRSYVLKRSLEVRSEKGYDVVDTDMDQVYKGQGVETAKTNSAVNSTAGEILTYGNEIAFTPFHSDSGGHTASNADVWDKAIPYLTGVPEVVSYKSPVSTWTVRISAAKIASVVAKLGGHIGQITEIQVSEVDQGGRAVKMTFVGTVGSKTLRASQFRLAVDPRSLKSTMLTPSGGSFQVKANASTAEGLVTRNNSRSTSSLNFSEEQGLAGMTAEGVFTTTELIDMLTNPNKKDQYYKVGLSRRGKINTKSQPKINTYGFTIERSGNDFVFYGRGWGHGVGLCQWGCMAMAEKGWKAENILLHYYPGTAVKKFK